MADWLRRIEQFNVWVGRAVAWLTLVMVLVTFAVVILRYWFDTGWIWLQESVTWMHAAVFMLAAAYTLAKDDQVRVDIFYRDAGPRGRALVDAAGCLLFLLPFSIFLAWASWDYVATAWSIREGSREAGGLMYPAVPMLKSLIPLTSLLLGLQGGVMLLRSLLRLSGRLPADAGPHDPIGPA
ncbi:MAG: TRAP transporter small permease subunit [Gammaproteobacteria bacterium]|nr:TRAP transporter small permease subunit [Gammaproteobacteria bacterium]